MDNEKRTLLFDLDGTLLPVDTDRFIKQYMKKVGEYAKDILPPEQMQAVIWKGTEAMIRSTDPHKTNQEVFVDYFVSATGLEKEKVWPVFDRFYAEEFPKLASYVDTTPLARQIAEEAMEQGYELVIATNPLFPEAAIHERLRWAGLGDMPFKEVTVYETCHFCKPSIAYFEEICARIEARPEDCIMIGNDMQEDMIAKEIGMKTFWVTDFAIDRGKPIYPVDATGSLEDLYRDLKERKHIFA
ncbi:MAG: HAD family hydrolase [Bacillaceae bacterium]|nr:HAD family hydrolase [Bacillaceae bacterium]